MPLPSKLQAAPASRTGRLGAMPELPLSACMARANQAAAWLQFAAPGSGGGLAGRGEGWSFAAPERVGGVYDTSSAYLPFQACKYGHWQGA